MNAIKREEAPVEIEGDGVELRMQEIGGDMTTAFVRLPAGADLGPALVGQPDDLCQCPHWGYLLKGRVKMRTKEGEEVYEGRSGLLLGAGSRAAGARGLRVRGLLADQRVQRGH